MSVVKVKHKAAAVTQSMMGCYLNSDTISKEPREGHEKENITYWKLGLKISLPRMSLINPAC